MVRALDHSVETLERLSVELPERLSAARNAIDEARPRIAAITALGFRAETEASMVTDAEHALETANGALQAKRVGADEACLRAKR
jgi:hypothetical protein